MGPHRFGVRTPSVRAPGQSGPALIDRPTGLRSVGIVAKKSDDRRHVFQAGLRPAGFPVIDARLIDAELIRDLSLQQLQREAPAQQMVLPTCSVAPVGGYGLICGETEAGRVPQVRRVC